MSDQSATSPDLDEVNQEAELATEAMRESRSDRQGSLKTLYSSVSRMAGEMETVHRALTDKSAQIRDLQERLDAERQKREEAERRYAKAVADYRAFVQRVRDLVTENSTETSDIDEKNAIVEDGVEVIAEAGMEHEASAQAMRQTRSNLESDNDRAKHEVAETSDRQSTGKTDQSGSASDAQPEDPQTAGAEIGDARAA